MPKLDLMKTTFAGFGVIARNPLAVLAWALVLMVLVVLPVGLMLSYIGSSVLEVATLERRGIDPNSEEAMMMMMPLITASMAFYPIMIIASMAQQAVLGGAVFRAVLEPENRSWLYLRLGAQELWLALLAAVFFVLSMIVSMVMTFVLAPFAIIGAVAWPDNPAVLAMIMIPVALGAFAAFTWLMLRYSMAFPMTFAERQFRLFESWSFTRGNVGRLFLVALLLMVMVMALYIGLWVLIAAIIVGVVGAGAMAGGFDEAALERFFLQEPTAIVAGMAPWLIGGAALACLFGAVLMTVFMAPWAEAYRQLRGAPAAADPAIAA